MYSKTCVKRPFSIRRNMSFEDKLLLNAVQKYCRMLQGEHSAILSIFNKLPFVIKTFVLSIFKWLFCTGFTVFWALKRIVLLRGKNYNFTIFFFFALIGHM